MSLSNNTIKTKKFQQFTYVKRQQLEMMLKIKGHCKHEIGLLLEKTKRSVNREILKGRVELLNSDLSVRIEQRAPHIDSREELDHWEMDY